MITIGLLEHKVCQCRLSRVGYSLMIYFSDDDILMAIADSYRFGHERYLYNARKFAIYIFNAVYQVRSRAIHVIDDLLMLCSKQSVILFFFVTYAYLSTTFRADGYVGPVYKFSTVRYSLPWVS